MLSREIVCPHCGPVKLEKPLDACPYCGQMFDCASFSAFGEGAMEAQTHIVKYHAKMVTIRTISAYGISGFFAIVAAAIVILAPESRSLAANIFAGAFLVLAVGIAGFTRFAARAPGFEFGASSDRL